MDHNDTAAMTPLKIVYRDEDELGQEYCSRVGCSKCDGTMPESSEPCGYGCEHQDAWVDCNAGLIAPFQLEPEEWELLRVEGAEQQPTLMERTAWEDYHPEDYNGPCRCAECSEEQSTRS